MIRNGALLTVKMLSQCFYTRKDIMSCACDGISHPIYMLEMHDASVIFNIIALH